LKEAQKAVAIHMAISSEGCENVKSLLIFFDKAKNGKIVPPTPIKCWGDESAMFKYLQHKSDESIRTVKQEFERKMVGCHIKLLFPIYLELKKNLSTLGK
jgi:hypothetical protein